MNMTMAASRPNVVSALVREENKRATSRALDRLRDLLRALVRSDRPQEVRREKEARFIG